MARLSFPGCPPRPAGVARPAVAGQGHRGDGLWHSPPQLASADTMLLPEGHRHSTFAAVSRAVQLFTRRHLGLFTEALASPRARVGPSQGKAGVSWAQRRLRGSVRGRGEGRTEAFLWLRLLECLTRRRFLEEPHLTIVTFTFPTFVIYVFIRSFEYWYLLLKGSTWCFAVELVFGFLQIL